MTSPETRQAKRFRVLVTGSRSWRDEQTIRDALSSVVSVHGPEDVTVVHGAASGADAIADHVANGWWGLTVERHPADWTQPCTPNCQPGHRRRRGVTDYCPAVGPRRDAAMVESGIDLCLAFINPCTLAKCPRPRPHDSHGAGFTADLAEKKGIETRRFTEENTHA